MSVSIVFVPVSVSIPLSVSILISVSIPIVFAPIGSFVPHPYCPELTIGTGTSRGTSRVTSRGALRGRFKGTTAGVARAWWCISN